LRDSLEIIAVLAACAIAYFTFRTLGEVAKQADSAQAQVGLLQKQLEAADRPWVSIKIAPTYPITVSGESQQFRFSIELKNVGHSVATNVTVKYRVVAPKWGDTVFKEPVNQQKAICGIPPNSSIRDPDSEPRTLFPGEVGPGGLSTALSREEMRIGAIPFKDTARIGRIFFAPVLVRCVDYTFASAIRHHQTGFIYDILGFDPARDPTIPSA
jgi:hypothetical protein